MRLVAPIQSSVRQFGVSNPIHLSPPPLTLPHPTEPDRGRFALSVEGRAGIYLGIVLTLQERLREAEGVYRQVTEICSEGCLDEAFLNVGLSLLAQERFEEAAECFCEAIHRDPDYRTARKALRDVDGCLKARAQLPSTRTVREPTEATLMDEDELREARFARLKAVDEAGLPALMILRARRYLAKYPDHGYAWYLLANALIGLARYHEAEEAASNALQICPVERRHFPLCMMGHLDKFRGEYDRAAKWYRKAIEAAPIDTQGYIYLGSVLARQGRLREAEEVHRKATETCSEGCVDEAFFNLGLVLRAQERFEEAAECFREAIHRDPGYRAAKKALRDVERCLRARGHRF
jgi:tetratricopeptide (TPR) repeat protein